MLWHVILTVLIIPVAVWILSSLFRGFEEERPGPGQRPHPREGAGRPRRPASDIDKFLEEINRRRREGAERQRSSLPERAPAPPVRPRAPTLRPEPPPRRPLPGPVPPQPRRTGRVEPEVVQVVVAAERPQVVAVRAAPQPSREAGPGALAVAMDAAPPPPPAATVARAATSSGLAQVLPLLRSPQNLRTAFLLREILGPPRCLRRRS